MGHDFLHLCRCDICPLNAAGRRRPVQGVGPDKAKVLVVGEAPGQQEAARGVPFIGPSGQLLDKTLGLAGISRDEVYVTNAVLCAPMQPGTKAAKPTPAALAACAPRLRAEIEAVDPSVVIASGATSSVALGLKFRNISEAQGGLLYAEKLMGGEDRWVMPTFHPAYILRNPTAFTSLKNSVKRAVEAAVTGVFPPTKVEYDWEYISRDDENGSERAFEVLSSILDGDWGWELAFDFETANTRRRSQMLQLAFGGVDKAVVIDAECFVGGEEEEVLAALFESPVHTWLMHNMSFDLQVLYRNFGVHWSDFGVPPIDTMCLALGQDEQGEYVGLKPLARKFFNAPYYEEELYRYLPTRTTPFSKVPRPILAKYAAADVIYTRLLFPILTEACRRAGTYEMATGLLMEAQKAFSDMEYAGVALDLTQVQALRDEWDPKIRQMEKDIQEWCAAHGWNKPFPINPGSFVQLQEFFYDINRLRPPQTNEFDSKGNRKRKTGKEWREMYADDRVWGELAAMMTQFKLATKLMSTYVDGIADDVDRETGRVHPSFKPWGTITGRTSIENPPLQTLPREKTSDAFANVRNLFVARPMLPERVGPQPLDLGKDLVFFAADQKQLELRIGWFLSHDETMGKHILSGDFHLNTAIDIFEMAAEDIEPEDRHNTKYVTFGVMYGRTPYSLALGQLKRPGRTLRQNLDYAEFFVTRWRETYATFWESREQQWIQAQETGIMRTPFDRVRRFPLRFEPGTKEWQDLRNQAYNFPYQSTASDLNTLSAIELNKRMQKERLGRVLFVVHDSVEGEFRRGAEAEVHAMLTEVMTTLPRQMQEWGPPPNFELAVDIEFGPSWGEARKWRPAAA